MFFVGETFVASYPRAASSLILPGQQAITVLLLPGAGPGEEEPLFPVLFHTRTCRLIYPRATVSFRMENARQESLVTLVAGKMISMPATFVAVKEASPTVLVLMFFSPAAYCLCRKRCGKPKSK